MFERLIKSRPGVGAIGIATVVLMGFVAVPALGGPSALSAANALSTAKRALKIAKRADKRSKKLSARTGPQGPKGDKGDTGATGAPGAAAAGPTKIDFRAPAGTVATEIFNSGKLALSAACSAGSAVTLTATTSVNNANIQSYGNSVDTNDDDFDIGETKTLSASDEERDVVYTEPGGQTVAVQYLASEGSALATCVVTGFATTL